jgi:hypothetical protein
MGSGATGLVMDRACDEILQKILPNQKSIHLQFTSKKSTLASQMKTTESPHLAAPGAGLPWIELQIARLLFRFRCLRGDRVSFLATFCEEQKKIRMLVDSFSSRRGAADSDSPRCGSRGQQPQLFRLDGFGPSAHRE